MVNRYLLLSYGGNQRRFTFHAGLVEGIEEIYRQDGALLETVEHHRGERSGRAVRYWTPDLYAAEEHWSKDQLVSGIYRDMDGDVVGEVAMEMAGELFFDDDYTRALQEYTDGRPDGEVRLFDETGQISNFYRVKNNKKSGEEIVYYPGSMKQKLSGEIDIDPQPQLLITWNDDIIHGVTKTCIRMAFRRVSVRSLTT